MFDESEKRERDGQNSLERYTHYYERWATNQSSRQKALSDLQQMQTVHLEKLSDKQCQPESQLKFIIEAWLQIVECRRVLKWTYAYGYYLPEHEHAKGSSLSIYKVRLSLDLNGFISARRKNSRGILMQKVHQENLMSSEQSLQGLQV